MSEAKKKSNLKWDRENAYRYWRATIVFPIEEKPAVLARAAALGLSLSDYLRGLCRADMESNTSGDN